jgi:hypothetical protein
LSGYKPLLYVSLSQLQIASRWMSAWTLFVDLCILLYCCLAAQCCHHVHCHVAARPGLCGHAVTTRACTPDAEHYCPALSTRTDALQQQRLCSNAHRCFAAQQCFSCFSCFRTHWVQVDEDDPDLSKWTMQSKFFGQDWTLEWVARNRAPIKCDLALLVQSFVPCLIAVFPGSQC